MLPKLESPAIKIPILKIPIKQWLTKNLTIEQESSILYITTKEWAQDQDWCIHTGHTVCLKSDDLINQLKNHSNRLYNHVFITDSGLITSQDKRTLLAEALRLLVPNGKVVAWDRAFDSESSILELLEPTGIDVSAFTEQRLKNSDISQLKPEQAFIFNNHRIFNNKKSLLSYLKSSDFPDITQEYLDHKLVQDNTKFTVNYTNLLMIWTKHGQ